MSKSYSRTLDVFNSRTNAALCYGLISALEVNFNVHSINPCFTYFLLTY